MTGNWYAIRTTPDAQKPKRWYVVEQTRSHKGYRVVPQIDHWLSAVERALELHGFEYYMPSEKRLIRDRRHTDLWKVRRFALMVGYIFVRDPHDWQKLAGLQGVSGIVCDVEGRPYGIDIMDILAMRSIEAKAEAHFDARSKLARQKLRQKAKSDPRLLKLTRELDMAGKMTVPLHGDILSQTIQAIAS
jgi:hypothetical protein